MIGIATNGTNGDDSERVPLQPSDIIISSLDSMVGSSGSNREFCQIVRLYPNGTLLARVLGTDAPRLMKVSSIVVNLSFIGAKEQAYTELRRQRETWKPGKPVEVFSRGLNCWCVGYVCRCIDLRSDSRIAHGDLWFQVVYFDADKQKLCYKQVKFDKRDLLADVDRLKGSKYWEQFHQELLKEKEGHLPAQLRSHLGKPVQSRSPSPQSSESTTSMGEDLSENGLRKAAKKPEGTPTPLFHRAPSIDELPDETGDKSPTDAVKQVVKQKFGCNDDLLAIPKFGDRAGLPQIRRQVSIDEEPKEPNEIQVAV